MSEIGLRQKQVISNKIMRNLLTLPNFFLTGRQLFFRNRRSGCHAHKEIVCLYLILVRLYWVDA